MRREPCTSDIGTIDLGAETESTEDGLIVRFRDYTLADPELFWVRISGTGVGGKGQVGNAALAAGLLPAMASGCRLLLRDEISEELAMNLPRLQELWLTWCSRLAPAEVLATTEERVKAPHEPKALFFSGGVDSFYSLLTGHSQLSHLIFVHGFDVPLADVDRRSGASDVARQAAAEFQLSLIEVETNLRAWLGRYVNWSLAHGAALASIAHLLSHRFGEIWISSTHSFLDLFPWGSHPLVDPLWGADNLVIRHHGCEASRQIKIETIVAAPVAMRTLRVCYEGGSIPLNCGECQKCLRTRLGLRAAGALERCATLPNFISPNEVATMTVQSLGEMAYAMDILERLESDPTAGALAEALRGVSQRFIRDALSLGRSAWNPFNNRFPLEEISG